MNRPKHIKPMDQLFEDNRNRLLSIGYRMLGSNSEAQDAVQDTYLRWARHWQKKKLTSLKSAPAYLTSITTRLCLDRLRRRKVEKLNYTGPWLPEPIPSESISSWDMPRGATLSSGEPTVVDAEHQVDQLQSVQTALLIMLEALTPQQRAVFILCEVFDYRHQEVANLLGMSIASSRQLLRRAKQQVEGDRELETSPANNSHQPFFEKFYEALTDGDNEKIEMLLCDDVVAYSDGGGRATAAIIPLRGIDRVKTVFGHVIRQRESATDWRWTSVNQQLGLVMIENQRATSVTTFDVKDGKVYRIYVTRNPEKLRAFNET